MRKQKAERQYVRRFYISLLGSSVVFFSGFWFLPSGIFKKWPRSVRGAEPRPLRGRARLIAALIMRPMVATALSSTKQGRSPRKAQIARDDFGRALWKVHCPFLLTR